MVMMFRKNYGGGICGDASLGTHEFHPQNPWGGEPGMVAVLVIPVLGSWNQTHWPDKQPQLLGELQASKRICLNKQGRYHMRNNT